MLPEKFQAKLYLTHFPVKTYLEAGVLARENSWAILGFIRRSGASGASADDISSELHIPRSVVYSTLKDLCRLGYVFALPREKRRAKERKKRFLAEKCTWGVFGVDKEFADALEIEGCMQLLVDGLKQQVLTTLRDAHETFARKEALRRYLPGQGNMCPRCGKSHEAMEFFYAMLLKTMDRLLAESHEFNEFLRELGYARVVPTYPLARLQQMNRKKIHEAFDSIQSSSGSFPS